MEVTLLPPNFMKDIHTFWCAIMNNGALPFEALGYPMSLHSLANNVLEEDSGYKNPPSGSNSIPTYLHQLTNDTRF
jgi:hypothetical protein